MQAITAGGLTQPTRLPPGPVWSCEDPEGYCRAEVSYEADMLGWYPADADATDRRGLWLCDGCAEWLCDPSEHYTDHKVTSLQDWLAEQ